LSDAQVGGPEVVPRLKCAENEARESAGHEDQDVRDEGEQERQHVSPPGR
jgi:hypothetical protein